MQYIFHSQDDEEKAAKVFEALPAFAGHAEDLLARLQESSGKH